VKNADGDGTIEFDELAKENNEKGDVTPDNVFFLELPKEDKKLIKEVIKVIKFSKDV
jgi:hypothetical protein